MKLRITLTKYCLFFFLLLTGCVKVTQAENPTRSVDSRTMVPTLSPSSISITHNQQETPVVLLTQTLTPTNTLLPPTQSIPTPSDLHLEKLFKSLQDETCQLPCYLGIVPGQTTFDDADHKLKDLGATNYGMSEFANQSEPMYRYSYSLNVYVSSEHVSQSIHLYVYNGNVVRMEVNLSSPLDQIFYKHWCKYSVITLLEQYGIPDAVHVEYEQRGGNDAWVLYNDPGILMGNLGIGREDNLVCPGFRENITARVHMQIFAPKYQEALATSSQFDGISLFSFQDGLLEVYRNTSIETILGIGPEQFYEQMMADPNTCFERVGVEP